MTGPKLTVGIPTLDRIEILAGLIASLAAQKYKSFNTIIISQSTGNNAKDAWTIKQMLRLLEYALPKDTEHTVIAKGAPIGAAAAHNIVLYESKTPYILRVDDDIVLEPNFIATLMSHFPSPTLGAVGGIYLDINDDPNERYSDGIKRKLTQAEMTIRDDTHRAQGLRHLDTSILNVTDLYSSYVYKRDAMIQAGGFREEYGKACYYEDTDASYRIFMEGFSLRVDPRAIGFHLKWKEGGSRLFWTEEKDLRNGDIFWKNVDELEKVGRKTLEP